MLSKLWRQTCHRDEDEDEEDEEDSDDDEDETAQLLAELEKIKRERAEEEERKAREISEGKARDREDEIAMGNPLLNLEAALGQGKATSGKPGTFAVKKRWDDGENVRIISRCASLTASVQMSSLRTKVRRQTLQPDSLSTICCALSSIGLWFCYHRSSRALTFGC